MQNIKLDKTIQPPRRYVAAIVLLLTIPLLVISFFVFAAPTASAAVTRAECENLSSGIVTADGDECWAANMNQGPCEELGGDHRSVEVEGVSSQTCVIPIGSSSGGGGSGGSSGGNSNVIPGTSTQCEAAGGNWVTEEDGQGNQLRELCVGYDQDLANQLSDDDAELATCGAVVTGVGYMVCPIMWAVTTAADTLYNMIESVLVVNPLSDEAGGYRAAWGVFRDIANGLFVIAFLIVIYSHLTNVGLNNYQIKKMLPRIIAAAILVNTSFLISAAAIDIFNVLGYGVTQIFDSATNTVAAACDGDAECGYGGWAGFWLGLIAAAAGTGVALTGILAVMGTGSLGAAALGLIIAVAPFILVAFLALLIAFLTLFIRQAILPILALLSPIAFVLYMLPNTEAWFKKWSRLFISMLMLFPLAAALFGGAKLAGHVLMAAGDGFVGLIVMTVPLFCLPFLASKAGPVMGSAYNKMRSQQQRLNRPARGFAKDRTQTAVNKGLNKPIDPNAKGVKAWTQRRAKGAYGGVLAAGKRNEVNKAEGEAAKAQYFADKSTAGGKAEVRRRAAEVQKQTAEGQQAINAEQDIPIGIRAQAKLANVELEGAKAVTDKAVTEAAALYYQSQNALSSGDSSRARTLRKEAADSVGGETQLAAALQQAQVQSNVAGTATDAAKRMQQQEYAADLQGDPGLVATAAGIGGITARTRVEASANSQLQKAAEEDLSAARVLVQSMEPEDAMVRFREANAAGNHTMAAAALERRIVAGNMDEDLNRAITEVGSDDNSDPAAFVKRQAAVQALESEGVEFLSGGDKDAIRTGTMMSGSSAGTMLERGVRNAAGGIMSAEKTAKSKGGHLNFLADAADQQLKDAETRLTQARASGDQGEIDAAQSSVTQAQTTIAQLAAGATAAKDNERTRSIIKNNRPAIDRLEDMGSRVPAQSTSVPTPAGGGQPTTASTSQSQNTSTQQTQTAGSQSQSTPAPQQPSAAPPPQGGTTTSRFGGPTPAPQPSQQPQQTPRGGGGYSWGQTDSGLYVPHTSGDVQQPSFSSDNPPSDNSTPANDDSQQPPQ